MLKLFKLSQLIFLIAAISIAAAWAADDGWKKIGESDGIAGYTRPTTRSGVDEIKAVGIVDASIAVVEAVIRDISIMPQYIFLCKESFVVSTPEMKSEGDVIYFYSLTDLPFPLSDRDIIAKALWSMDKSTGAIYCHSEGVKTAYKQNQDVIRMPLSITDCKLVPKGADKTEVTYQVLGDPGGKLPHFLVSMFTKNYGIKTIAGLRQMVKKDKLKNVKKVVTTTTRIQR
ncbi:MAG: START domain-containing protein [Smithella sp.]